MFEALKHPPDSPLSLLALIQRFVESEENAENLVLRISAIMETVSILSGLWLVFDSCLVVDTKTSSFIQVKKFIFV